MAKTIWDYKVSFPYGATSAPYSKSNPHKGEDRAAPAGTPITVNGVQIGLVGTTGYSTGNHCHIGKWSGGTHKAPNGGGKTFKSAVVTQVAQDAVNGKYVRVQADGYSWVYLHMSKQTAKVGQKLVAPKPKPAYPKWVKVVSKGGAYVRSKPTTASPLAGSRYLPYLTPFRVSGVVKGQSIGGNSTWYKSMYGNYIWSGNAK